jgi:hypothetical protein
MALPVHRRSVMRPTLGLLLSCALLAAPVSSQPVGNHPADGSVLRLQVVTDAGKTDGTCVLIHREDRGAQAVLFFLTSSRQLREPDDQRLLRQPNVRLLLDSGRTLDVRRDDISIPAGAVVDIAVLRTAAVSTGTVPRVLNYEPPSIGEVFHISGYDHNGAPVAITEHVQFRSTLLAVGDRDTSALEGCIGAPAISSRGVFGVVTECDAGRPPVIALISVARSFIDRHLPRTANPTAPAPPGERLSR